MPDTNCKSMFFVEKRIICLQNQLPITFCSDLVFNKTLKARHSKPTHNHTNLKP